MTMQRPASGDGSQKLVSALPRWGLKNVSHLRQECPDSGRSIVRLVPAYQLLSLSLRVANAQAHREPSNRKSQIQ